MRPARRPAAKLGRLGGEPVGKQPDLLAQALGSRIVGKEFEQLVLEDAGAAWLKKDERQPGIDLRSHAVENTREIGAGSGEKAEVVEWTAAADVAAWDFDLKSGLAEDSLGGGERLRMVVVVPGVGPQQDLAVQATCASADFRGCGAKQPVRRTSG